MAMILQRGNGGIRMVREDGYVSPLELIEPVWVDDAVSTMHYPSSVRVSLLLDSAVSVCQQQVAVRSARTLQR